MSAPSAFAVRAPFHYSADAGGVEVDAVEDAAEAPAFITNVFIEVLSFGQRFFWLHVSESPTAQCVPRIGACSVAVGLQLSGDGGRTTVSAAPLMDVEAAQTADTSAGTMGSPQSVFAASLSQRLVRGIVKRHGVQTTIYVCCAIEGERSLALLGTGGGSGFGMTYSFGAFVHAESMKALSRCWAA
ncbi:hypothetical protein NESM_000847000 [Novymonas esmeraldas]|uniref:Uncharacterized protein n=1 Tax=Novymonas esmeraldas TaxID=1808958 RepID=A0AAW0EZR9_9TRYP